MEAANNGKGYGQGGGGYSGKGGHGGYGGYGGYGGQQGQQQQQQPAVNQNNQNQAIVPVNSVEQQNGEQHGYSAGDLELTPPSQVVATAITGPSGAWTTTGDHGELSRATTLLYPQYLWAQVMGQQMVQPLPAGGPSHRARETGNGARDEGARRAVRAG